MHLEIFEGTWGERNAGFLTLVSSAHRNDLDVWAYVSDILKRLLAGESNYEPLLPWNWAATHPQSIRQFRQEERRARDTRSRTDSCAHLKISPGSSRKCFANK